MFRHDEVKTARRVRRGGQKEIDRILLGPFLHLAPRPARYECQAVDTLSRVFHHHDTTKTLLVFREEGLQKLL